MPSPVRIHVLVDAAAAAPRFATEWGLSLAIELPDGLWLWDVGQSDAFLKNARLMGLDLGRARGLALSHGHYDHTGGLDALFHDTGFRGLVFAQPEFIRTRYVIRPGETREIGIPGLIPEYVTVRDTRELTKGLAMLTDIRRRAGLFQAVDGFFFDREGTEPDAIPDDAFLVLNTSKGAVVILGCGHSGLSNSLASLEERLGIGRVHAILGGLHLFSAPESAWEETARAIEASGCKQLWAGHCTGEKALEFLTGRLECEVREMKAGMRVEF
jgi:7,8-dihydropterin-6-yl-methyl-4-(beta-D-ribofuranosyl)aminobenzene 5'-phosphate synthase